MLIRNITLTLREPHDHSLKPAAFKLLTAGINDQNLPVSLREQLSRVRDDHFNFNLDCANLYSKMAKFSDDPKSVFKTLLYAWGGKDFGLVSEFKNELEACRKKTLLQFQGDPTTQRQALIEFNNIVRNGLVSNLPQEFKEQYWQLMNTDNSYTEKQNAVKTWCLNAFTA